MALARHLRKIGAACYSIRAQSRSGAPSSNPDLVLSGRGGALTVRSNVKALARRPWRHGDRNSMQVQAI